MELGPRGATLAHMSRDRTELGSNHRLSHTVASAALDVPRVVGVEVQLDDAPTVVAGRAARSRTVTDIVARGSRFGRIVVSHRGRLERTDRAALELLAAQVGLAVDNQRLLEQRDGLGRLLAAHEEDRERFADALHDELAQVLAAVLLGLRMLRRRGSLDETALDELHDQIVGVLDGVRDMAGALRPAQLAHLGLVPALEALCDSHAGLSVEASGIPEPLPEPLRTGIYRLIESALAAARPGPRHACSSAARARGSTSSSISISTARPRRSPRRERAQRSSTGCCAARGCPTGARACAPGCRWPPAENY
jgi:signal transduction histidine kinase